MRLYPYLALVRPANIITAISDVLAGVALAGMFSANYTPSVLNNVILLCISTSGLYAGGIVFNDVFDLEIDKSERPERSIPSGMISERNAIAYGIILFLLGLGSAALVSTNSLFIAIGIVIFATCYDRYFKHMLVGGPVIMGLCRGLNLLLGMSILQEQIPRLWFISLIPLVFIAAVTLTSQGEVQGNNKQAVLLALTLDTLVAITILVLGWNQFLKLSVALPFVVLWIGMNAWTKLRAILHNEPKYIMGAVKIGVISLIPLNASYVAGSSNWLMGLAVLLLLPLSLILSKKFAVT